MSGPSARPLPPLLHLVPGRQVLLLVVGVVDAVVLLAMPPARLLDGLRTARTLQAFGPVERDEDRLDEILPWTGNV